MKGVTPTTAHGTRGRGELADEALEAMLFAIRIDDRGKPPSD